MEFFRLLEFVDVEFQITVTEPLLNHVFYHGVVYFKCHGILCTIVQ